MSVYPLDANLFTDKQTLEPIRAGFGRGLLQAGKDDERVVALSADLTESTQAHFFAEAFPERFVEVGIAEQNMATVAAGMAMAGKIPFATSFAAFHPGRNWEQIKTTSCLNELPVRVVGSHAGLSDGPDGGTHQMLEDIALTRVLPQMIVIAPGDSLEAERATMALAQEREHPAYLRLAREKTPVFSTTESPFEIGKAYVLREGSDATVCATGTMTYQCLEAAQILEGKGISLEVVHVPTIKPLDEATILASVEKTGRMITAEEAQIAAGLGGAIAELIGEKLPVPLRRIGIKDHFGESGSYTELMSAFKLDGPSVAKNIQSFIKAVPQYKKGF